MPAADSLIGGTSNDVYVIDDAGDAITDTGGTDTIQSYISYTLATGFEKLTLLGSGNINGTGTTAANLTGNDGNNTLDGFGGTDSLLGGAGDDTYVIDGSDTISENTGEGTDTVLSSATYTMTANLEILTLSGSSNINGTGNADANVITGNSGLNTLSGSDGDDTLMGGGSNDSLAGGNGNDTLDGGTGNDTMTGGANDDLYIVDSTTDVCTESSNSGTDTVQASATFTLGNNIEKLTLTGSSAINGTGNTLDNVIVGNTGANTLSASSGNDTLDGGDGLDSLTGGTGADTFVFHSAAVNNIDVITDYNKVTDNDKIDIHDVLIGYSGTVTDWVRISDSGSNSTLEVDRDGTGGTYG